MSDAASPDNTEIDPGEFRRVLGHFPTGVTVVTGADADGPAGMAIGSFASVSLDPPLVMFCPGNTSASWLRIKETGAFCVNVLAADQKDTCGVFASKAEDKFEGIDWTTDVTGAPVIPGSLAVIDCELHAILDGGDHDIVVGLVKSLRTSDEAADTGPLLFYQGGYGRYEGI
ncbi:MAG: flavin reductase family protein [Acidimicrobiales bacterium]|nr:flavin reductase family protein [Acidimicrobiales bacterium]